MIYRYLQLNKTSTQNDMLHYKMCVQANGVSHVNMLLEIDFSRVTHCVFTRKHRSPFNSQIIYIGDI